MKYENSQKVMRVSSEKWVWISTNLFEIVMMRRMVIYTEEERLQTLAQVKVALDDTAELAFQIQKVERNAFNWIS